jgi:hypothetical protein
MDRHGSTREVRHINPRESAEGLSKHLTFKSSLSGQIHVLEVASSAHPCPRARSLNPVRGWIEHLDHVGPGDFARHLRDLDDNSFAGKSTTHEYCSPIDMSNCVATVCDGSDGHFRHLAPVTPDAL